MICVSDQDRFMRGFLLAGYVLSKTALSIVCITLITLASLSCGKLGSIELVGIIAVLSGLAGYQAKDAAREITKILPINKS